MASYQLDRQRQYGGVFKTNIFLMPTVFCTTEDSLVELGKKEGPARLTAFFPPHHQKLFGPSSLLVTSGARHDRIRRLLGGGLSPGVVEASYRPLIGDEVDRFFDRLRRDCADHYCAVVPRVRALFVRMMLRIVLGAPEGEGESGGKDADVDELAEDIEVWSRGLLAAPLTFLPWSTAARAMRARGRVAARLRTIMDGMEAPGPGKGGGGGLLAKLLGAADDGGGRLSRDEIVDNVLTLLFAGSDTTASATVSLWRVLSGDDGQSAREWLASESTTDEQVDRFLEESVLSRYPPAPFGMRLNGGADLEVGGYRVPAGWLVVYGFAGALLSRPEEQRRQENASLPAADSKAKGAPNSWIPFGTGPRQCPGRFLANLELRAVARRLATLRWTVDPDQDLEQRYTPGLFPVDGFRVRLDA
jgi:cytochrome P450